MGFFFFGVWKDLCRISRSMLVFDLVTRFRSAIPEFVGSHDDLNIEVTPG
jgi:hypothetical protein